MDAGSVELAGQVVPYLTAVAAVYGTRVLEKVTEHGTGVAADATTRWGVRILGRLRGSARAAEIESAVADVAENPDDEAFGVALLAQVRRALREDPALAAEIAGLVTAGPGPAATFSATVTNSPHAVVGSNNRVIGNRSGPLPTGRG